MTFFARDGSNTLVEIGASFIRDGSNALVEVGQESIRDASGLSIYFAPGSGMTVEVPPDAYGAAANSGGVSVTTNAVTATVTGGTAPFTYLWSKVGGADPAWTIISPTSQTTAFRRYPVAPGDEETATFICTVTDASGTSEDSAAVAATVTNFGGLGGFIP